MFSRPTIHKSDFLTMRHHATSDCVEFPFQSLLSTGKVRKGTPDGVDNEPCDEQIGGHDKRDARAKTTPQAGTVNSHINGRLEHCRVQRSDLSVRVRVGVRVRVRVGVRVRGLGG